MKLPLQWLREYVAFTLSPAELAERLTVAGLEISGVRVLGLPIHEGLRVKPEDQGPIWDRDKILIAQVLEVSRHPNADKLKLVRVNLGQPEPKVVVTGAPNIAVGDQGQKVILALTGSVLFDGHSETKKLSELKPTMLRGVPSDSMVCSAYELGIYDDHDGIIIFPDDAPAPGTPLVDFLGDVVLQAEVLPNMARCLSMIGVAREVAALDGKTVTLPDLSYPTLAEAVSNHVEIRIENPKLCARYSACLIREVQIAAAPAFMQWRLVYAGMRPINNIVDITNYVMLEWGQPLHAFDYDVLVRRARGAKPIITVRSARAGEKLVTLDQVERTLTPDMLVIADEAGPIALAGVMGGLETEVSESTRNILLESANFDFVSIRRTMKGLNLLSEASTRFSKGIHPELVPLAAKRACQMMHRYAGGQVLSGMVDVYPAPLPVQTIELRQSEIRRLLGCEFAEAEVEQILRSLEFTVQLRAAGVWSVEVPPHRLDIQEGEADLIEELARIRGYDRLPSRLLADALPPQRSNRLLASEERVRDLLALAGLQEVITYALTTPAREAILGEERKDYVTLLNPISEERTVMRQRLLPGVLEVAANNLRHTDRIGMFEIGAVYLPQAGQRLPEEPRRLAIVRMGPRTLPNWDDPLGQKPASVDFFDLKGIIETLMAELHLPQVRFRAKTDSPFLHPGRAAELMLDGQPAGVFGELHPKTAQALDRFHKLTGTHRLAERTVLVAELDLAAILQRIPERYAFRSVSPYPAALRDIALIVDASISHEQVVAELQAAGGDLLTDIRLFDVYVGESIPAGKKSLAYALAYQAGDRTLSDKEIDKAHEKVMNRLRHTLKAMIRGKDDAK